MFFHFFLNVEIVDHLMDLSNNYIFLSKTFKLLQILVTNAELLLLTDSNLPILTFPEGATTNNKKGLLKFNIWPFLLNQDVQPVSKFLNFITFINNPTVLFKSMYVCFVKSNFDFKINPYVKIFILKFC